MPFKQLILEEITTPWVISPKQRTGCIGLALIWVLCALWTCCIFAPMRLGRIDDVRCWMILWCWECTCLSRMSTAHTQLLFLVFILTLWRLCKAIQVLGGTLPNCWQRMTQLRTFYCFVAAWQYWKWWDLWNWLAETAALLFLSCCYVIISMLFHGCSCFPGNKWNKSCRAEIHPSNIHWTTLQRHIKL